MSSVLDNYNLIIAIEVISYFIIAMLGIGIAIRAASLYARYKAAKNVSVPVEDGKVLKINQEEGYATIICKEVVVPEGAEEVAAEEAPAEEAAQETEQAQEEDK